MSDHLSNHPPTKDQSRQQQHIYTTQSYQHTQRHQQHIQPRKQRSIGNYILGKTIGRGASGRVKIGIHRYTDEKVAVKMIQRKTLAESTSLSQLVQREAAILQLVHHPNIVHFERIFQDRDTVYFVMEYVQGGDLFSFLSRNGRMTETDARNLFSQLSAGLSWCHAHHICHRDLKPENVLLDKDKKHLKIADFGIATIQSPNHLLRSSCGSPHYASPEIVKGEPYYGPATDIWSCGVILYVMLAGTLPFQDSHLVGLMSKIKLGRYTPLPDFVSPEARDLVRSMLVVDPSRRIPLDEVLAHPWLTGKSFLGPDLRFPDALAFSNHHNQCYQHNALSSPLHDRALAKPLCTDALDGRTWETLKVLWRHYTQEQLTKALTSHGPNVPKLTCHLLIQRAWRENQGIASAASSSSSEDDNESMPTTPPPGTLPFGCTDSRRGSSGRSINDDASTSTPCDDWAPPCSPLPAPNVPRRFKLLPSTTSATQLQTYISGQKRRPSEPTVPMALACIKHRPSPCVVTLQKDADTMATRHSFAQATIASSEQIKNNAVQQLQSVRRSPEPRKGWLDSLLDWWGIRPTPLSDLAKDRSDTYICVDRHAKHEYEAAGKLHQVLEECFGGKLSGRIYPTGELIWTGSIATPTSSAITDTSGRPERQGFRCSIHTLPDTDNKSVEIRFFPVKDDIYSLRPMIKDIIDEWDQYEEESHEVAKANGWPC